MTTSHFDRSALPLPEGFYRQECGKLSRPSRGWARSRCPLHGGDNPTSFAVNLDTGGFYCHACGAKGGDVLEFVRLRYQLSFPDALKRFHIETRYQPKPKRKEPPISLDRMLARKLAMAIEYGTETPADE
jgi:DNA primase